MPAPGAALADIFFGHYRSGADRLRHSQRESRSWSQQVAAQAWRVPRSSRVPTSPAHTNARYGPAAARGGASKVSQFKEERPSAEAMAIARELRAEAERRGFGLEALVVEMWS